MSWVSWRWRAQLAAISSVTCKLLRTIRFLNANGTGKLAWQYVHFSVSYSIIDIALSTMCVISEIISRISKWQSVSQKEKVEIYSSILFKPEVEQEYPLNLSISLSGGKETNRDSLSNGEWTGKSSIWKLAACCWIVASRNAACGKGRISLLERSTREGESPVFAYTIPCLARFLRVAFFVIGALNRW